MARPSLRERRLLFVTGKGGVGKTTIAAGLAQALANEGTSVLLCAIDNRSDIGEAFGLSQLHFEPQSVSDNLSLMVMDTESALRDYLRINMKIPVVTKIGPIANAFDFVATAAPGVREILTIGKLCYDVRENLYDVVVVDAPATGHIIGYLAAPQAINALVRVGLIRNQTDWMLEILSNPEKTGVVIVTTPEEMPVVETLQLLKKLEDETTVQAAAVVVNRTLSDLVVPRDEPVLAGLSAKRPDAFTSSALDGLFEAARLSGAKNTVAHEHLATLRQGLDDDLSVIAQPYLFDCADASSIVQAVATSLGEEIE